VRNCFFFIIKFAFWVSFVLWVCRCNNLPAAGMGLGASLFLS
jgi:hypothetical protein